MIEYFDVRQMERPHRSGVLAVCVAYALLYALAEFSSAGVPEEATLADIITCHLAPILCIDFYKPPQQQTEVHEYRATKIIYCPTCHVKAKENHKKEKGKCSEIVGLVAEPFPRDQYLVEMTDDKLFFCSDLFSALDLLEHDAGGIVFPPPAWRDLAGR